MIGDIHVLSKDVDSMETRLTFCQHVLDLVKRLLISLEDSLNVMKEVVFLNPSENFNEEHSLSSRSDSQTRARNGETEVVLGPRAPGLLKPTDEAYSESESIPYFRKRQSFG